ncbi:cyanoexosortase A system-associated protein [Nostoc sp. UHCC 0870]|uniref:cyanoexosortase A system-associated protein n=1 Tax=Nostoc sp. UHCC 0870 TaxID=2914041 RepID=UPI001EDDFB88|nr:cyanoexosortase A system-associated protein [Nostoc sp. UHCC 0870]UKO98933.1 cyanoexosortase A system-associated protein [Nostoc sp. UHCC 0870]
MIFWKQARPYFLACSFLGILLVLLKSIVAPVKEQPILASFTFPSKIDLSGWQFQSSEPVTDKDTKRIIYQYTRNQINLKIEMNYVVTLMDNESLFHQYNPKIFAPDKPRTIIRQNDKIGAYSLSVQEDRVYLRSCINPNSPSAITYEQFIRSRYTSDIQLHRLLPALLGQESLRDSRCFWTHLSIPIQNSSPESTYQILENVWFSWYQYWPSLFN